MTVPLRLLAAARLAVGGVTVDFLEAHGDPYSTASWGYSGGAWTWSGAALGDADADRHIVVAVGIHSLNVATLTTVTVAGVSATIDWEHSESIGGRAYTVGFAQAAVPTGTTGDIFVEADGFNAGFATWRSSGALALSDSGWSTSGGASVTNPPGGIVLGAAYAQLTPDEATSTTDWTGLTEMWDFLVEDYPPRWFSGGYHSTAGAATVTPTFDNVSQFIVGAVAYEGA